MQISKKNKVITLSLILIVVTIISLFIGQGNINVTKLISGDTTSNFIFFQLRLPRIICAILIGVGLSIAGLLLQTTLNNDLADSSIIGINSGISFFVLLYIMLNNSTNFLSILGMPLVGIIGALISIFILFILVYDKDNGINSIRMCICGIALNIGFQGLILFFSTQLDKQKFAYVQLWNAGIITGNNYFKITILFIVISLIVIYIIKHLNELNIFILGKESATTLGLNYQKMSIIFILLSCILSAFAISFGGSIPFVGLLAPHIAKKLIGNNYKYTLVCTMLIGAALVLVADALAKILISSTEIPTGIIMSIIGVPYFIYLLRKENSQWI
ncbi:FecCD family ABC transporter permease [Mycoplasma sp. P36-A1]|uniref:FecCD family ABC transporter permease n=1 Tax=Mycoplasma sp. P36-A1 TaxID=3252900 RepID=UPI003C2EA0D9